MTIICLLCGVLHLVSWPVTTENLSCNTALNFWAFRTQSQPNCSFIWWPIWHHSNCVDANYKCRSMQRSQLSLYMVILIQVPRNACNRSKRMQCFQWDFPYFGCMVTRLTAMMSSPRVYGCWHAVHMYNTAWLNWLETMKQKCWACMKGYIWTHYRSNCNPKSCVCYITPSHPLALMIMQYIEKSLITNLSTSLNTLYMTLSCLPLHHRAPFPIRLPLLQLMF